MYSQSEFEHYNNSEAPQSPEPMRYEVKRDDTGKQYASTDAVEFFEASEIPPPANTELILLSNLGVTSIGKFIEGFHVAWLPMPKRRKHEPEGA